ncbi:MAG: IS30 family transposase [Kineosporiaceae bacterium]|nr:IS30 family transposase [Kineosporiaceae bacterium]
MPGQRITSEERVRIECWWTAGWSIPRIADALGRDRTAIWREVTRNHSSRHGPKNHGEHRGGRRGVYRWGYRADRADLRARRRALRPRTGKLRAVPGDALRAERRRLVLAKLRLRWSPEQIAGWLRTARADRPELWVCHETIYQALYVQSRGNLRAELSRQVALRSGRVHRIPRGAPAGACRSGRAWAQLNIADRPAEAADRVVPGHWEGDLILGARNASAIATLVERTTRFVLLVGLQDGKLAEDLSARLITTMGTLPSQLRGSLTWDLGNEMADNATFTLATDIQVYFCDPHSPWQRGTNENTNRLLRQYFPKGSDLSVHSQDHLDAVAAELNNRPRQTLQWQTPQQQLNKLLVATTT